MAVLVSVATSHEIRGSIMTGYVRSRVHQNEKNAGQSRSAAALTKAYSTPSPGMSRSGDPYTTFEVGETTVNRCFAAI